MKSQIIAFLIAVGILLGLIWLTQAHAQCRPYRLRRHMAYAHLMRRVWGDLAQLHGESQ